MTNFNTPQMRDEQNEGQIKRYVHSPLAIEHYGTNAAIHENGKVTISKVAGIKDGVTEYDEVEIPASLVFKLASLLKATRKVVYVSVTENAKLPPQEAIHDN